MGFSSSRSRRRRRKRGRKTGTGRSLEIIFIHSVAVPSFVFLMLPTRGLCVACVRCVLFVRLEGSKVFRIDLGRRFCCNSRKGYLFLTMSSFLCVLLARNAL